MSGEQSETVARIATQGARQWQFKPAQSSGKAVASEQVLRFAVGPASWPVDDRPTSRLQALTSLPTSSKPSRDRKEAV